MYCTVVVYMFTLTSVVSVVLPAGVLGVALLLPLSCRANSSRVCRADAEPPGDSGAAKSPSDILQARQPLRSVGIFSFFPRGKRKENGLIFLICTSS